MPPIAPRWKSCLTLTVKTARLPILISPAAMQAGCIPQTQTTKANQKRKDKESKEFVLKTKFVGHKKWVWDCDFSLDSMYLISCSSDKTIKIWALENGKVLTTFNNPKGVNHIALADDESD